MQTKDSRKVDLIILFSGDVLCYYYGDLLTEEQVSEKYDQHEITPDRLMKIYPFNRNAPVFIDASNNCLGAFINSNYETNEEYNVEFVEKSFDNPSKVDFINIASVIALRDIMDGQELLIDYGPKFSFNENESKHKFISIKSSEDRFEKEKRRVDEILSKTSKFIELFQRHT